MKNLDFKMRERFHRREQDEDRRQAMEFRKISKMKAAHYAEDKDPEGGALIPESILEEAYKNLTL